MNHSQIEVSRNLGFISTEEQDRLSSATVAIAGAGGDGGELAVTLARMGVGEIRLADPDPFEAENINRQACCSTSTIGVNKATAVGEYIKDVNPRIEVKTFTDGVTPDNVEEFVRGSDLLIDESEFSIQAIGVMLAREARKENIPNLMALNLGFGATVTTYHPHGTTFERMIGLREDMPLDEVADKKIPLSRWAAYLPPYADLGAFKSVASGEKSVPSVAPGVAIAAGNASIQAFLNLVQASGNKRPRPIYAPHVRMYDGLTGESKLIKHPLASHYRYLARMVTRNVLQLNPKVDY